MLVKLTCFCFDFRHVIGWLIVVDLLWLVRRLNPRRRHYLWRPMRRRILLWVAPVGWRRRGRLRAANCVSWVLCSMVFNVFPKGGRIRVALVASRCLTGVRLLSGHWQSAPLSRWLILTNRLPSLVLKTVAYLTDLCPGMAFKLFLQW